MACEILIDACNPAEWSQLAENFDDNNVYQTRAYQKIRAENDGQDLKSIIIKDNDDVILMCHMRIQKVPLVGLKVGYVQSGPLMMRKDGRVDKLPEALHLLGDLVSNKMAHVLRMNPNIYDDERGKRISEILGKSIGMVSHVPPHHTMRISLNRTEEEIRSRFDRESRRLLRKAEERNIENIEGTGGQLFAKVLELYSQAKQRKGFKGVDATVFSGMQEMLPENEKAKIIICYSEGKPITVHVTTHYGNTALPIITANNEAGLKLGSSYIVWWKAFVEAKTLGMEYYDLGGIDKVANPQGYQFKKHLGGDEIFHIGSYEICKNEFMRVLWRNAERAYNLKKKYR
jgi:lipid II:glycine glycyltransferase (peptidoglycan interpeptide bridge formation enzyme)